MAAWTLLADHPKSIWPCSVQDLEMAYDFVAANMALHEPVDRRFLFLTLKKVLNKNQIKFYFFYLQIVQNFLRN
jgi:hypothetical protein